MKKCTTLLLFTVFSLLTTILPGQYASVNFDLEKNYFNEGQPLPAGKNLMFTGVIPQDVSRIEIDIFSGKKVDYTAVWKKAFASENTSNFNLAVNYKLRASDQYDFQVRFFQNMSYEQINELRDQLTQQVAQYLWAAVRQSSSGLQLMDREKRILRKADEIAFSSLNGYRRSDDAAFPGFSVAILQKLEALDGVKRDSTLDMDQVEASLFKQVEVEVDQYIKGDWSKLLFSRFIDDYETERKQRSLSVNVGYGGVYLSGEFDDFTYGDAPYAGLLLPISSSIRAPKFFRNTSLNLGVFFSDFENIENKSYSGFIIDQPIFVGLNFKLFQFIGLDAGATLMQESDLDAAPMTDDRDFLIRPYIGLSARLDIAIGLGK